MTSAGNRNTILIGDCVNILPQIDAGSIDFILTDPPYVRRYKPRDGRTVPNDDNFAWLKPAFAEMFRVLRSDSFCVSFYGWPNAGKFVTAFLDAGFRIAGHFVLPKPYTSPGTGHVRYQHECAYLLAKGSPAPRAEPIGDVIPWTAYTGNKLHPTQKPLGILKPVDRSFHGSRRCGARPVQRFRIFAACGEQARPLMAWHRDRRDLPRRCQPKTR